MSTALVACEGLDLGDCFYWGEDCVPRLPTGLHCGLAHGTFGHTGGGCVTEAGTHDPAWQRHSWGVVSAGTDGLTDSCPDGFDTEQIRDHDDPYQLDWSTCTAEGDASFSALDLSRIPAGSACGLTRLGDSPQECMGYLPSELECPPGFRLRWLVDEYFDQVDADVGDCISMPSPGGDLPGIPEHHLFEILVFCEVEAEAGCLDCADTALERGYLCGLHNRDWIGEVPPIPIDAMESLVETVDSDGELYYPIREFSGTSDAVVDLLREKCASNDELMGWIDALEPLIAPPSCLGQELRDGGSCPSGMVLACTGDYLYSDFNVAGDEFILGDPVSSQGLCWCAPPEARLSFTDLEGYSLLPEVTPSRQRGAVLRR